MGFSGVGICQPTPAPVGTRSHNPCGFVNLSYSLEIAPLASFSDDEDEVDEDASGIERERDALRVSFSDDEYDDEQGLGHDKW